MALTVTVRVARPSDTPRMAAIEHECFEDASWRENDFLRYDCTVAEVELSTGNLVIAGFIVSRETSARTPETPPEREILNVAVSTQFRRTGIAKRLLEFELARHATTHLEVRASNAAAIYLYEKMGFKQSGVRRGYYDHPVESAIVMSMKW